MRSTKNPYYNTRLLHKLLKSQKTSMSANFSSLLPNLAKVVNRGKTKVSYRNTGLQEYYDNE